MPIYALSDLIASIDPSAFVHPEAVVIGSVSIGAEASVWPSAVLRADFGELVVGGWPVEQTRHGARLFASSARCSRAELRRID